MLGKLIKYEFRATRRVMLPLLAAVILLSPLVGLCVSMADPKTFGNIITFAVNAAFTVSVIGVFIASFVLMIRRFYTSLLCDEGYLTFTLPVDTSALVFSKLIVSFVWLAASLAACCIGGAVITWVTHAGSDFSGIWTFLRELSASLGVGNVILYCVEAIVCAFLFSCFGCLHFYAAMALGYSFSKHRTLLSVCFYILLSMAMSFLFIGLCRLIGSDFFKPILEWGEAQMDAIAFNEKYASMPHIVFGIIALYSLIGSALYFIPTILPLKKRLNLN